MAIVAGSYTVGSGGDYANWRTARNNLYTAQSGNITFTQIGESTDSQIATFNHNMAGYNLTLTSSVNPSGNFSAGYKSLFTSTTDATSLIYINTSSSVSGAIVEISNLNIRQDEDVTGTNGEGLIYLISNANVTIKVHDCLIDGVDRLRMGIKSNSINGYTELWNNVCVRLKGGEGCGYFPFYVPVHFKMENCTAYDCTTGFWNYYSGDQAGWKNLLAISNSTDYSGLPASASGCASTDSTGNTTLRLIPSGIFVSTVITNATYLKLNSTTGIGISGVVTSITSNTTGNRGTSRPHEE